MSSGKSQPAGEPGSPATGGTATGLKRQFAWSVAPLLVTTALNLASVRLNILYLGDELYAVLTFVAVFTGMFGFADMGLGVAVGRYIGLALGRGDTQAVKEYWGTGNLIVLPVVGLAAVLFAVAGAVFGTEWFNVSAENEPLLRSCFIAGGAALFFNFYGQFWLILSQAHLDFRFIGILRTIASTVHIIPAVVIAALTRDPLLITLWNAVVAAAQLAALMWHARSRFGIGLELRHARRSRAGEMAAYTGKTFATLVITNLFGSIDRFMLGRLTPEEGRAYVNYTNCAANVGTRLQTLGAAIMGPVFHNTNRALGGEGTQTSPAAIYNETFHFVIGWYALVATWAAVWHPVVLTAWLGATRGPEVEPLFTPLIIAFCLTALSGVSAAQLTSMNRMGAVAGFSAAAGILAALGIFIGWQLAGITGRPTVSWRVESPSLRRTFTRSACLGPKDGSRRRTGDALCGNWPLELHLPRCTCLFPNVRPGCSSLLSFTAEESCHGCCGTSSGGSLRVRPRQHPENEHRSQTTCCSFQGEYCPAGTGPGGILPAAAC